MREFVAIDFETGNPKRVSACALGYTIVQDGVIRESNGFLIKPVGGHAQFQTKIHGLCDKQTADKPEFGDLFPSIAYLFDLPIVGHSMFDKQVLHALSEHFNLSLQFDYTDSVTIARQKLPNLSNHKLKTVAKHFELPKFKHHDASEDARACAEIFIRLTTDSESPPSVPSDGGEEFAIIANSMLSDDVIDYKEACELKFWLEDHLDEAPDFPPLLTVINQTLEDDQLEAIEAEAIKALLKMAVYKRQHG